MKPGEAQAGSIVRSRLAWQVLEKPIGGVLAGQVGDRNLPNGFRVSRSWRTQASSVWTGYDGIEPSRVTIVSRSQSAWATSIRSNGSR